MNHPAIDEVAWRVSPVHSELSSFHIPRSDICYGGTPMPPMGRTRHSFGGIGDIPKTLGDGFHGSWKPSARPVGAIGTTLGKGSQHPWKAFP